MAWQSSGMNVGNAGNGDASQSSQPQGTEYTLQGVMRFLQTEWHRHERDRNAWEIERQEMRARIASLEGAARRTSKTQNGQNKYIRLLENAVKAERAKAKAVNVDEGKEPSKDEKATKTRRQRPKEVSHNSFLDVDSSDAKGAAKQEVGEMRNYIDTSQQEFTYLMVSATNPSPPRGPIQPEPTLDDYDAQSYDPNSMRMDWHNMLPNRPKEMKPPLQSRPSAIPEHQPPPESQTNMGMRNTALQPSPAMRSMPEQQPQQNEPWTSSFQMSQPPPEDNVTKVTHTYDGYGRPIDAQEPAPKETVPESEGWDFNESTQFPEPESKPAPQRPDTDLFPSAQDLPKSPSKGPSSHRRKGSMSRRRSSEHDLSLAAAANQKADGNFKVRFGLRGHLDAVRSVIFTGGGSPGEPEICTAGDDGTIKRWIIPARYENQAGLHNGSSGDLDIQSFFTHRGHTGAVMCLASWSPSTLANGGRTQGDGWVFSGGQDSSVRVWERGRIDPKATLDGHTDAVWALCVLPATCGSVFGQNNNYGGADRILLVSGAADGTVRVWSVSTPPQLMSPQGTGTGTTSRRSGGRVRGNSVSSGTSFPTSPQPSLSSSTPFHHTLIHTLKRANSDASPTSITPLSSSGDTFVVAYSDAATIVYDTRTGEEIVSMASLETYDGTNKSGVNAIVATTSGLDGSLSFDGSRSLAEDESVVHGATGSTVDGIIITGHEDRFIRFFDANSGQCTYNMLAHPAAISALSLSPDGRELVSAGHDASLRFWSLETRSCTQEITSHRLMRGEGVCDVIWSQDGRWVVSGGGDGVVKVFAR